jgi:hypothetical protein
VLSWVLWIGLGLAGPGGRGWGRRGVVVVVFWAGRGRGSRGAIVLVAASRFQVSGRTARRRWRAVRKSVSQGHRAGIRSVTVGAVRVTRPGTLSSRRRMVRAVRDDRVRQPDQGGPFEEVVRERGDHGPGGVGEDSAGGEVRECLASS